MFKAFFSLFSKRQDIPPSDAKWSLPQQDTQSSKTQSNNANSGKIQVPLQGNGSFAFDIVGEGSYQAALEKIAGKKTREGKSKECKADVSLETDNPHDPNAVVVKINGLVVGYFGKMDAKDYSSQMRQRQSGEVRTVSAKIVGGYKEKVREGHYGVKLDVTRNR